MKCILVIWCKKRWLTIESFAGALKICIFKVFFMGVTRPLELPFYFSSHQISNLFIPLQRSYIKASTEIERRRGKRNANEI